MELTTTEKLTDISIKAYGLGCALSLLDDSLGSICMESSPVAGVLLKHRRDDYHNTLDMMRTDLKSLSDAIGDIVEILDKVGDSE